MLTTYYGIFAGRRKYEKEVVERLIQEQVEQLRTDVSKKHPLTEAEGAVTEYVLNHVEVTDAAQTEFVRERVKQHVRKEIRMDDSGRVFLRHTRTQEETVSMLRDEARRSGMEVPQEGVAGVQQDQYAKMDRDGKWTFNEVMQLREKDRLLEEERRVREECKLQQEKEKTAQEKEKTAQTQQQEKKAQEKEKMAQEKEKTVQTQHQEKTTQEKEKTAQEKEKTVQTQHQEKTAQEKEKTAQEKEKTERLKLQIELHNLRRVEANDTSSASPPPQKQRRVGIFDQILSESNRCYRGLRNVKAFVLQDIPDRTDRTLREVCAQLTKAVETNDRLGLCIRRSCRATGQVPLVYATKDTRELEGLVAALRHGLQGGVAPPQPSPAAVRPLAHTYTLEDLQSKLGRLYNAAAGRYAHFSVLIDAVAADSGHFDEACCCRTSHLTYTTCASALIHASPDQQQEELQPAAAQSILPHEAAGCGLQQPTTQSIQRLSQFLVATADRPGYVGRVRQKLRQTTWMACLLHPLFRFFAPLLFC